MKSYIKKVLVTQSQMKNYSGSEIATLEIIEHLCGLGVEVTLLTGYVGSPVEEDLKKVNNLKVVTVGTKEEKQLKLASFDLVWIHHLTMTEELLAKLAEEQKRPLVVFHHMSYVEPFEFPTLLKAEESLADIVLFNSEETKKKLQEKGVRFNQQLMEVFGNPAPETFYLQKRKASDGHKKPQRVAIISNHLPDEMREATTLLKKHGIITEIIGRVEGGRQARVLPELVGEFDVVVSIGKSVQYCIVNNTPVYCYDRFGGPGYVNESNYRLSLENNFSGRGFDRKSPEKIAREITGEYTTAIKNHEEVHKLYANDFRLSERFNKVVSQAKENHIHRDLSKFDLNAFINYTKVVNKILPGYLTHLHKFGELKDSYNKQKTEIQRLRQRLEESNKLLKEKDKTIQGFHNDAYWRVRSKVGKVLKYRKHRRTKRDS